MRTVQISTLTLLVESARWRVQLGGYGFTNIKVTIVPESPRTLYQATMPDDITRTEKPSRYNPYSIIDADTIEEIAYEKEGHQLFTEVIFKKGEKTIERIVFFHPS